MKKNKDNIKKTLNLPRLTLWKRKHKNHRPHRLKKANLIKTTYLFRIDVYRFFGSSCVILHFIFNEWKSDQSQAGTMLDKSIKSSNIFGKLGDWLGNFFIFESIGIASFIVAFLFVVFGTMILKKKIFKPWMTFGHSLFFICWLPIFFGAITKGQGNAGVLSGVYGYQIMDSLNAIIGSVGLWLVLVVSIAYILF